MKHPHRSLLLFSCSLVIVLFAASVRAQVPVISYLIPDIGTPGQSTYVEIVGPANVTNNFGPDLLSLNNPGDPVQVVCANPADTAKIRIGPVVVSWNGRLISTQIFVMPGLRPNSFNWQQLQSPYRIPLAVIINGRVSRPDSFYIVQPQLIGPRPVPGLIGSGGAWGIRSRRGAMIVDSISFTGQGLYAVSTLDCDPRTPGNQGLLPFVLLSHGPIRFVNGALFSASGIAQDAGAGGGGGGAGGVSNAGEGYTSGGINCGAPNQSGSGAGGGSMTGVAPGGSDCDQGGGGGTGHPFGNSGAAGSVRANSVPGGHGGGSGGGEEAGTLPDVFGGGGGGNATTGATGGGNGDNHGQLIGNAMVVPLAGGSGGGAGNMYFNQFSAGGSGGSGGGAICLHSSTTLFLPRYLTAEGIAGTDGQRDFVNYGGAGGGGGAGGAILTSSKLGASWPGQGSINVAGGPGGAAGGGKSRDGGAGGAGRIRIDGLRLSAVQTSPPNASVYDGPSTDTSSNVGRSFILTGTGTGTTIVIFARPLGGAWSAIDTITTGQKTWSAPINLPGNDSLYFLVAAQLVPAPRTSLFDAEPQWVLSQAATNIIHAAPGRALIASANAISFPAVMCGDSVLDTLIVHNPGSSPLVIARDTFVGPDAQLFAVLQPAFPDTIAPGDSARVVVRFANGISGAATATLRLISNATNAPAGVWDIRLTASTLSLTLSMRVPPSPIRDGDPVIVDISANIPESFRAADTIAFRLTSDMTLMAFDSIASACGDHITRLPSPDTLLVSLYGCSSITNPIAHVYYTTLIGPTLAPFVHLDLLPTIASCMVGGPMGSDTMTLLPHGCELTTLRVNPFTAGIQSSFPNPTGGAVRVEYRTTTDAPVRITLVDAIGRTVRVFSSLAEKPGIHAVTFEMNDLPVGMYTATMETNGTTTSRLIGVVR